MQQAIRQGGFEAVMRNHRGELSECSQSNLFVVRGGTAYTPPLDAGLLAGITREFLFEVARTIGVPMVEATLRDEPSAIADWPVVRAYVMGAVGEPGAPGNVWDGLDRCPPRAATHELFLSADGGLGAAAPGEGELPLVSDPGHPVYTLGGANLSPDLIVDGRPMGDGPQDQRPIEAEGCCVDFRNYI